MAFQSFRPDVVTPERRVIPDVEAAVCDDGVGPGFFHVSAGVRRLVGRGKAAFGPISLGGWFDQCDLAVFPVQIETIISVTHGSRSKRRIFPE